MDWFPFPLPEVSREVLFLSVRAAPPVSGFYFYFQNALHIFFFLFYFCLFDLFSVKGFSQKRKTRRQKEKSTEEINPPMVPTKDLYLFCTCIVFQDVFNYFGCWNKACLCGQLDAGYVIFLPWPQCLSLSMN